MSWQILLKDGLEYSFGFSIFLNTTVIQSGPESSSIIAGVDFVNSSYIASTVTFKNADKLNGSTIVCEDERISFEYCSGMMV